MFYYQPYWTDPSKEEWLETVKDLANGEEWVMDENYGGTMDLC